MRGVTGDRLGVVADDPALERPARAFHLSMIAVCAGSSGSDLGTRWLVAVLRPRSTSPLRVLMTREVSVTTLAVRRGDW